jgi:hypothetical protein
MPSSGAAGDHSSDMSEHSGQKDVQEVREVRKSRDVPMLLKRESHWPSVDPSAVLAANAILVGDVRVGARCVIGYGASLIAEGQPITLGEQVIVRDNAVIRSTANYPVAVGNAVLIGPVPHSSAAPSKTRCSWPRAHGYSTSPSFANRRKSASMLSYT